ncbi:MAG: V-type ATP synthase subunit I [Chloroflexi bacterium]|nr:V-type ATP synthase subunit I [Chloroflexota bacterium]
MPLPILINTPESMLKVRIITLKDYAENTVKTLQELGVFDLEQVEAKPDHKQQIESDLINANAALIRIEHLLSFLPETKAVSITGDLVSAYRHELKTSLEEIEVFYKKIDRLHDTSLTYENQLKTLKESKKYLALVDSQLNLKLRDLNYSGRFLFSGFFIFPQSSGNAFVEQIEPLLLEKVVAPVDEDLIVYVVAKSEYKNKVISILNQLNGRVISVPDNDLPFREYFDQLDSKIAGLEKEYSAVVLELRNSMKDNLQQLLLLRYVMLAEKERLIILQKAFDSKYITMLEGWVPESSLETVIKKLQESNKYALVDSREPLKNEEPPTKQKNAKLLKPFEVIVNLFAIPKYKDWDPTPVIAYSFAIFFGLMFNDVIYGIVLILGAKFVLHKLVDDPQSEGFILFRRVLMISGGTAAIFGLLSGSYLGDIYTLWGVQTTPALIPVVGVWLGEPLKFLVVAIFIGLFHTNLAHLIGLYNGIKKHEVWVIPNKIGLFIFEIFGIPILTKALLGIELIPLTGQMTTVFTYLMFFGIALIVYSQLRLMKGLGLIFWLFDLTGLLGDVMSYARIAGVSMAGFYLAASFNQIAGMVRNMIPGVAGLIIGSILMLIILLFAHLLNVFLGTLSAFVHSLRLCFVEFLMKFYEGGGKEYTPLKLKMPKTVVTVGKT